MKTFKHNGEGSKDSVLEPKTFERKPRPAYPEASFAKAAYEWSNALLLAAEKMWGDGNAYKAYDGVWGAPR